MLYLEKYRDKVSPKDLFLKVRITDECNIK